MERSLGATFFLFASVAFAIAFGSWWLDRAAFSPDTTTDSAVAILADPDIRRELVALIAPLTAPRMDTSPADVTARLQNQVFPLRAGAAEIAPILYEAHKVVIGDSDQALMITGDQLIPVVRDQRAADVPTFRLPLEEIGTLATTKSVTRWMVPIAAGVGLIMVALGLFTRPERREVVNALGELLVAMAVSLLLFGWAIPVHFFTAIDSRTWTRAIPHLAMRVFPVALGMAVVLSLAGAFLILNARSGGGRKQWSTPLSVARYRGGDNPGWS